MSGHPFLPDPLRIARHSLSTRSLRPSAHHDGSIFRTRYVSACRLPMRSRQRRGGDLRRVWRSRCDCSTQRDGRSSSMAAAEVCGTTPGLRVARAGGRPPSRPRHVRAMGASYTAWDPRATRRIAAPVCGTCCERAPTAASREWNVNLCSYWLRYNTLHRACTSTRKATVQPVPTMPRLMHSLSTRAISMV